MVSFDSYYSFRNFLIGFSPFFKITSFILSLAFLYFSIFKKNFSKRGVVLLTSGAFVLLFASLILLILFHQVIFSTTYISVEMLPEPIVLRVPLWIESAKLFFWSFLTVILQIIVLLKAERDDVRKFTLAGTGTLLLLTSIYDPFSNPFPQLHQEIQNLDAAVNSGLTPSSIAYIMNFFYRAKYFYNSHYMWTHPPLLFASYAFFVLAFSIHIPVLVKKNIDVQLENYAYQLIKAGYLFLTVGMLIGYPWATEAWKGEPWWWSAKINVSIMMWLFYTGYLHARIYIGRKTVGRLAVVLAVISFLALIFTYLTTYLIPGVHSYG